MNKWWIIGGIGGVVLLALVMVGIVGAGVGGEASKMHDLMEQNLKSKPTLDEVKEQLTDAHYQVNSSGPSIEATGPTHSLVVYQTHLTLKISFDADGKMTGYHLDRV